jgi:TIR domain
MGAHDVFISYSHEDKPVANATCAVLERNRVRCWIAPRDVELGMS